jgi:hypothetical protein
MKNYFLKFILLICCLVFLAGCRKDPPPVTGVPEDDTSIYITFRLQNIDSVRYWGDSEKIRLQSGMIILKPENHTYLKKFIGTSEENIDPAQETWSKEEPGKYYFSADSSYIIFSNGNHPVYFLPGYWRDGIYNPSRLEQHDSVCYSILYYSMATSGRFIYTGL